MSRTDRASLTVDAPPDAVYRAFSEPDALMAWLPPGTMTGRALEYDFREGGRYRIELSYTEETDIGKTTGQTDVSAGRFVELVPGRRIAQTVEFDSEDAAFSGQMLMTWTFEAQGEGTRVTVVATDVPEGIRPEDHAEGLRGSLDNLARHLAP